MHDHFIGKVFQFVESERLGIDKVCSYTVISYSIDYLQEAWVRCYR